jgi:hypothetical protein
MHDPSHVRSSTPALCTQFELAITNGNILGFLGRRIVSNMLIVAR